MLSAVMLGVIMLIVVNKLIMLSAVMLGVIKLSDFMQNIANADCHI